MTKASEARKERRKTRFEKVKDGQPEIVLNVMSNEPKEGHYERLAMFYRGAAANTIAYMEAKDVRTGEIVPILVGFELNHENKFDVFPLARVLEMDELQYYRSPDGKGGYAGE